MKRCKPRSYTSLDKILNIKQILVKTKCGSDCSGHPRESPRPSAFPGDGPQPCCGRGMGHEGWDAPRPTTRQVGNHPDQGQLRKDLSPKQHPPEKKGPIPLKGVKSEKKGRGRSRSSGAGREGRAPVPVEWTHSGSGEAGTETSPPRRMATPSPHLPHCHHQAEKPSSGQGLVEVPEWGPH